MVIASQHVASSKCYFSVVIVGSVKNRVTENNSKVTGCLTLTLKAKKSKFI